MRRQDQRLAIAFVGVVLLIAGAGRLFSADPGTNAPPDVIRIPVLVVSIALGLVITSQIARAAAASYLEAHRGVSPLRFWLIILGFGLTAALAFLVGSVV